jgi:hypothetical protein
VLRFAPFGRSGEGLLLSAFPWVAPADEPHYPTESAAGSGALAGITVSQGVIFIGDERCDQMRGRLVWAVSFLRSADVFSTYREWMALKGEDIVNQVPACTQADVQSYATGPGCLTPRHQ